ncbi:metallophosphoesterase [Hoeflea alexandrii]
MKLVHISDIHINGEPILGHDSIANFKKCLAYVEAHDHDADRVVITGDLTHYGLEESYRELQFILEASSLKGKLAPRLMIGNHDSREMFASMFAETNRDAAGFVQWTEETPAGLFGYMDTVDQGKHSGRYCQQRMDWLRAVLDGARAKGQRAYLFMHHNPVRVHVANADIIGIIDERALQALLSEYKDTVPICSSVTATILSAAQSAAFPIRLRARPITPAGLSFQARSTGWGTVTWRRTTMSVSSTRTARWCIRSTFSRLTGSSGGSIPILTSTDIC